MTEDQLQSMSEQEIRARFRCAPDYYLQAKLDKKRTLEGRKGLSCDDLDDPISIHGGHHDYGHDYGDLTDCWDPSVADSLPRRARPQPASLDVASGQPLALDLPLPGFEILDAALAETDDLSTIFAEYMDDDDDDDGEETLTQQAILEAALEDYANWPIKSAAEALLEAESAVQAEPESQGESELERKLTLVLNSEPELKRVLDEEPELEVVLHSEPALEQALDAEAGFIADNVTLANFGNRAPRTVPVVSVVMDRKRPNMVRVVGMSTRLAS